MSADSLESANLDANLVRQNARVYNVCDVIEVINRVVLVVLVLVLVGLIGWKFGGMLFEIVGGFIVELSYSLAKLIKL